MSKICVITGTRAEYGLLKPIIEKIKYDNDFELQLVATGMHLSPEFGLTYKEIENDGFKINEKVEILLSSDSSIGISKSMGLAIISFSEIFERIKPDIIIVLGDRYEIFSAVSAAMIANIPIAHLHGGEATEGLIDEAIRHSITKMSYLHFTSTEEYRKRVIQLGENPERVYNVGAISVEIIKELQLLSKEDLEKELGIKFDTKVALLTFHPVTLENNSAEDQFNELLKALDKFKDIKVIFTKSNSDTYGRIINNLIDNYVMLNSDRCVQFTSMGQLRYLSAMKYCNFVIGNSSSGILEAPILKKPTINIGDRQKGRIQMDSIINCEPTEKDIVEAIKNVISYEFTKCIDKMINPYGEGNVSKDIMKIIKGLLQEDKIKLKKQFYNIDWSE